MVISLEGDNFVEFYNLSVCEIWPDKRSGVYWEGLYKGGLLYNPQNYLRSVVLKSTMIIESIFILPKYFFFLIFRWFMVLNATFNNISVISWQ